MIVHAKTVLRGGPPSDEQVAAYLEVLHRCEEMHKSIRGARSRRRHRRLCRELFQAHFDQWGRTPYPPDIMAAQPKEA